MVGIFNDNRGIGEPNEGDQKPCVGHQPERTRRVRLDPGIRQILDALDFLFGKRGVVGTVEAQTIGRDQ